MREEYRKWTVEEKVEDRLDVYLAKRFPHRSRTGWAKLVKEGWVKINQEIVKPCRRLRPGDVVTISEPPPPPSEWRPEPIPLEVIYEDEHLLAICKPAGLLVHPAREGKTGTLINALLAITSELSSPPSNPERLGIVHRLDKDTSGILLVAKNNQAHEAIAALFRERKIHKEYLALTLGVPSPSRGKVEVPLGRSRRHWLRVVPRADGKEAKTDYVVEKVWKGKIAKVRLFPKTGRTHQIRVHLKYLGCPVLCDPLYGRKKKLTSHDLEELFGKRGEGKKKTLLKRQALHAFRLTFELFGRFYDLTAPWPEDLQKVEELFDSFSS